MPTTLLLVFLVPIVAAVVASKVSAKAADKCGTIAFALLLVLCTVPPFLISVFCQASQKLKPIPDGIKSWRRWAVYTSSCLCWRLLWTLCSPWVRIHREGLEDFRSNFGASGKPAVLIGNHMSFADTLLGVPSFSVRHAWRARMMVSHHLLKIPALGKIIEAMDHYPVKFTKSDDVNSMEVDKVAMAETQRGFEAHVLQKGGFGVWYPEGRMNPGPDYEKVCMFRAGGFGMCCREDMEIWCLAQSGMAYFWSRYHTVGGRPSDLGVKIFKLCDSSKALVAQAGGDEKAQTIFLANLAQQKIQAGVDELVAAGHAGPPAWAPKEGASRPLLQA